MAITILFKSVSEGFEVLLKNINFQNTKVFETSFFLYPYSRNLTADSFEILPYEEYINDLTIGKRSTYDNINVIADKIFGFLLGFVIFIFFLFFLPSSLVSVESVISIFAAYSIGKDLWHDIDSVLINLTHNWKISWRTNPYFYIRQDLGTIQKFWSYARVQRYKLNITLPWQLDFITHSNSKTVEMEYRNNGMKANDNLLLGSIKMSSENKAELLKKGFMFGIKVNIPSNFLFFALNSEYFQAINTNETGITLNDTWQKDKLLIKKTLTIGRVKFYYKDIVKEEQGIITIA